MITIKQHIKALIFDCDGTLADTMSIHDQSWHETLAEHGVTCQQSFLDDVAGMPTKEIVELINKKFNQQIDPTTFVPKREERAFERLFSVRPITPIVDIAKKHHGKLPMSVVSGGAKKHVIATLDTIGIKNLFDTIITADDPVTPKPSPDIFLLAANYMNIEPKKCQVFEDGEMGMLGAEKAGMVVTDVRPYVKQWLQQTS